MPDIFKEEASLYAQKGLDGDYGEHEDCMRRFAYAQVQATIYVGNQLARLADTLESLNLPF